jgi:hypothetical protein
MRLITLTVFLLSSLGNYHLNGQHLSLQVAEKVYLHIDRVNYSPGDDIWFKAYVIDPGVNKLSVNTNNLHVEFISPFSGILDSRMVRIEGGTGNGDFHLPDSVSSGRYRIRAYTNRMRNLDDRLFFTREIIVINPSDEGPEPARDAEYVDNNLDISFFPEGGSLIDNVESTVAFKAADASGKGCDVSGELFSSSGELITVFNSTHLGMGAFNLKPDPGISYYATVKSPDGTLSKVALPVSFPTGMTLTAMQTTDRQLLLTVRTNIETLMSLPGRDINLSFSLPSMITRVTRIKITSLANNFVLPVDDFPDGITRVTLSGIEGLPLAERLVYIQKNNDVFLNVSTDKKEYQPREKTTVTISLSGDASFSGTGNLSLSAAEAGFTDHSSPFPTTIASWFLLESDVHGPVEQPSYYFDPANENRLADLDLLLLTQGWRDFQWKYDTLLPFIHEIGFTVSGKVKRLYGNNPVVGVKINMGLFGTGNNQFHIAETDSAGEFRFEELDFTGDANMFLSSTGKNERNQGRIFVDSLFYEPPQIPSLPELATLKILTKTDYTALKQEAVIKLDIKKKYKLSDTIQIGEVIISTSRPETQQETQVRESRRVYGTPDKEMVVPPEMDNFAGDVFDMISGRISGVQVIRSGGNISVVLAQSVLHGPALILLDGMVIDSDNLDLILTIPPYMIDRVDVLGPTPAYGASGANGVINIITRSGMRKTPKELASNAASIIIKGFDVPRIFYSPKHDISEKPAYTPDTRTTIFWKPYIKIDSKTNLEYFNADSPVDIDVIVEGVTGEGIPVTGKTVYSEK